MLAEEKMKQNKYLIVVADEELLELKVKNINFLFPITEYSVGFPTTFSIEEINSPNAFLYINRILDKKSMEKLKKDLLDLKKNIMGICFTDLGILGLVKEMGLNLQLIYMQNHNTTNKLSIKYYLEYVDSVLVSTDITKEEIMTILDATTKPLVVPYFSLVDAMYSRRTLLTNYGENFGVKIKKMANLHEDITGLDFVGVENSYGTVLYYKKFIDYRKIEHSNILYRFVNPLGLDKNTVEKILYGDDFSNSDTGFLYKETYYLLREEK